MAGPERTCIVCRSRRAKGDLLRIARAPEGPRVDPGARAPGRGAYVCRKRECVERGPGALPRALRVALDADDLARLGTEMETELE